MLSKGTRPVVVLSQWRRWAASQLAAARESPTLRGRSGSNRTWWLRGGYLVRDCGLSAIGWACALSRSFHALRDAADDCSVVWSAWTGAGRVGEGMKWRPSRLSS
jgi:hypothetical protein